MPGAAGMPERCSHRDARLKIISRRRYRADTGIAASAFLLEKHRQGSDRLTFRCKAVIPDTATGSDPSPFTDHRDAAEEIELQAKRIEPPHLSIRVDAMQVNRKWEQLKLRGGHDGRFQDVAVETLEAAVKDGRGRVHSSQDIAQIWLTLPLDPRLREMSICGR